MAQNKTAFPSEVNMSAVIIQHCWKVNTIKSTPKLVLMYIATVSDDFGKCEAPIPEISKRTGLSYRAVCDAVSYLRLSGILVSEGMHGHNKQHTVIISDEHIAEESKTINKKKIPAALRSMVFERDMYRCKNCGTWKELSVDHIHPESLGGLLVLENLQTLCRPCNSKKGTKTPDGI